MFLILDITAYDLGGDLVSHGSNEVSVTPEFSAPEFVFQRWELLEHFAGREALEDFNGLGDGVPGRKGEKEVDMIGHDLHGVNVEAVTLSDCLKYFLESISEAARKKAFPVFRGPDDMVLGVIDSVAGAAVSHPLKFTPRWSYFDHFSLWGAFPPRPKGRGIQASVS